MLLILRVLMALLTEPVLVEVVVEVVGVLRLRPQPPHTLLEAAWPVDVLQVNRLLQCWTWVAEQNLDLAVVLLQEGISLVLTPRRRPAIYRGF